MSETDSDVDGGSDMEMSYPIDFSAYDNTKPKQNKRRKKSNDDQERRQKRMMLTLTRPSYTLTKGAVNVSEQHRIKLQCLLVKLVRQQNWVEAAGVLSTLLKGTYKERSVQNNRRKYWVAMELLRHVETNEVAYSKGIECLYYTWMGKIQSWKNKPLKDKNARLESILSVLAHNTAMTTVIPALARVSGGEKALRPTPNELSLSKITTNACLDAKSLTFSTQSANDPLTNLVIGLTFYESWYSTLPKELQVNVSEVSHHQMEIENDPSVEDTHDHSQVSSAAPYYLQSLLPINLPCSKEMLEALHSHARSHDYSYKNALKHLQHGFKSTPAVSEASLLPLIQLLFLGDRIEEATAVLDKACKKSNSVLPLRLRAYVWEVVDANDSGKLSTYFEDVLKKDPTCKYALARLVKFHHKGDYDPEQLVEMLALHLEVTYPDYKTWREFASCLLKLSQCKKTRTSVFISGMSRKTWKVRSKWWLNRHFSKGKLVSEMSAGDLKLITYKAACASHLYGKELEYVTKVNTCLKEHDDKPLLKSLKLHIQNSVGFYSNLTKKRSPIVELRCHTTFSIMY